MLVVARSRLARAAVLVSAISVLAACGGSDASEPNAAPPIEIPSPTAEPSATATPSPTATPSGALLVDPATDPALATFYDQKLSWTDCGFPLKCASLTVPIDWADPTGGTFKLKVSRVRAEGATPTASILVNPGGPGGPGLDLAAAVADRVGPEMKKRYDIVGFDPRGVGTSAPLDCLTDRQLDRALAVDPTPDDDADLAEVVKEAKALADGCKQRSGELLAHVDTESVARDVDALRSALGDRKLNWLGYSYGTYIGSTYARMFPTRVGRMVLDGVVDPALDSEQILLGQAKGFELAVSAFFKDCLKRKPCEIGKSEGEIRTRILALFKRADSRPLGTRSGRKLTEASATFGALLGMYSESFWPSLRAALVAAYAGDGTQLLTLADQFSQRGVDGKYADNSAESIYAVNCLDHPGFSSVEEIQKALPEFREASPLFGEPIAWGGIPCEYWPVSLERSPGPVLAPGAPPILVLGTTNDPATPYEWSVNLAKELESGVLLTREGEGHTAHGSGNRCIDKAVDKYFLTGTTPKEGTRC